MVENYFSAVNLRSPELNATEQTTNSLERLNLRNTIDASMPIKKTNLSLMLEEARLEIGDTKSPMIASTKLSPRGLISPNASSALSPVQVSPSATSSINRDSLAANVNDREAQERSKMKMAQKLA